MAYSSHPRSIFRGTDMSLSLVSVIALLLISNHCFCQCPPTSGKTLDLVVISITQFRYLPSAKRSMLS